MSAASASRSKRARTDRASLQAVSTPLAEGTRVGTAEYPSAQPHLEELPEECTLVCPGCSAQDVALGRCHATVLASARRSGVAVAGMAGLVPGRVEALAAEPSSVFVGRRPPRGMPRVWAKGWCARSPFANPFVVQKNGYTLAESLALYRKYVAGRFVPLSSSEVVCVCASAARLPTVEEVLAERGILYKTD